MLTLLISLLVALHMTSGTHHCSPEERNAFYKDESKWVISPPTDYKGNETTEQPLPFMSPYTKQTSGEINKQINRELFAHYTYLSMAMHFDRDDINLPGFHKFFKESAEEEMEHAQKFMKYQNMRGGRVKLNNIHKPCEVWGNGLNAMRFALNLEKEVYESLLILHSHADLKNDPQLQDFLESNFLGEQVESIKQLANYVNTLTRLEGSGNYQLGEYQFDKITLKGEEK